MNNLKAELDAARREYEGRQYPGDLAAEVLPDRPRRRHWLLATAAAVIALMVIVPSIRNGFDGGDPGPIVHIPTPPMPQHGELPALPKLAALKPNVSLEGVLSMAVAPFDLTPIRSALGVDVDLENLHLPGMSIEIEKVPML